MSFLSNQDVQFELSNPLYYPDDSAPPIPNISVSHLDSEGANYISSTDTVSLVDDKLPRSSLRRPNAFMHYSGMPQTRTYSTESGTVTTTGDHLFYSHLNVESSVPTHKAYSFESLDTYFNELVPAVCGLHNISTHGLGVPIAHIHSAHHLENSFAIQGVSNLPMPLSPLTLRDPESRKVFNNSGFDNSQDMSRDYEYLDIVIRVERKFLWGQHGKNTIQFYLNSENVIQIEAYTLEPDENGNDRYVIWGYHWKYDLSGDERVLDSSGQIFYITASHDDRSLPAESNYVFAVLRLDLNNINRPGWLTHDGNSIRVRVTTASGYHPQLSKRISINNIFAMQGIINSDVDYNLPLSVQVIGYPTTDNMPELIDIGRERLYPNPHEYAYSLYRGSPDVQFPFIIPNYTGNMWEHVNKVATGLPHQRNVG